MNERRRVPDHGTRARYTRGCSCVDCCAANTAYMAQYRRDRELSKVLEDLKELSQE
jgi:hypothetical protein